MRERGVLPSWVVEALDQLGGSGSIVDVCRVVWERHEVDLRNTHELFFTWQYDIRWAAQTLRKQGVMTAVHGSRSQPWSLARGRKDRE